MKLINRLLPLLLALPVVGQAQVDTHENIPSEDNPWYEVSVVIFKQPGHLLQSEQWKPGDEQSLSLPRHLLSLEDPEAKDIVHEFESVEFDSELSEALVTPKTETASEEDDGTEVKLPTAFLAQEPTDEEFISTLNRLTRSPNYDILYQKTWLQPGLEKKEAIPILIQAGEVYDGLFELEGTATLHVARYLHFKSNMWLSKYVQQLEVIKPWWQDSDEAVDGSSEENATNNEFTIEPISLAPAFDQMGSTDSAMGMGSTMAMGETITRYKSIRTGVMNESRRMRSGELHYLDHPLFGIVVKVTPYELPEEEEEEVENEEAAAPTTASTTPQ